MVVADWAGESSNVEGKSDQASKIHEFLNPRLDYCLSRVVMIRLMMTNYHDLVKMMKLMKVKIGDRKEGVKWR